MKERVKRKNGRKRRQCRVGALILAVLFFVCFGIRIYKIQNMKFKEVSMEDVKSMKVTGTAVRPVIDSRWYQEGEDRYYYKDGTLVTGWLKIDGDTYYFDEEGVLCSNQMIEKNRFVDKDGKLIEPDQLYQKGVEGLSDLKTRLQEMIDGHSGLTSVYVKNLDTNEYMVINDQQIKSASLIKLYSMGTIYDEVEKGNLELDSSVYNYLYNMITVSDNGAYNHLLSVIGQGSAVRGVETISAFCVQEGFDDTGCGSTLSCDETGFTPVWQFTNYTSARDCGHLMEEIYRGTLVSEEASEQMLELLLKQEWTMKIPAGLPAGVVCANKTGEYENRQHDSAIVYSEGADYILSVMTDGDPGAIMHIQSLSAEVYKYFNEK